MKQKFLCLPGIFGCEISEICFVLLLWCTFLFLFLFFSSIDSNTPVFQVLSNRPQRKPPFLLPGIDLFFFFFLLRKEVSYLVRNLMNQFSCLRLICDCMAPWFLRTLAVFSLQRQYNFSKPMGRVKDWVLLALRRARVLSFVRKLDWKSE